MVLNPMAGCRPGKRRQDRSEVAALGFAPAGTAAGRGRSRSVESARGVVGQRLRCSRGFKAETIIFLMKAVAMLWLNLRERVVRVPWRVSRLFKTI